jgi:hypothetical protein
MCKKVDSYLPFLCYLVPHKIFFKKAAATIGQMSILPKTIIGQESFRSMDVFRAVAFGI